MTTHPEDIRDELRKRLERRAFQHGDCILWGGRTLPNGYGVIRFRRISQSMLYVHRAAWELSNGRPCPVASKVCHKCDVRNCINPAHLFIGTDKDNSDDKCRKERQARGESHGRRKLSESSVREIIRRSANGESTRKLAADFCVAQSAIANIRTGRKWRHIHAQEIGTPAEVRIRVRAFAADGGDGGHA